MILEANKFALATAATMGVGYAVCAAFTAAAPDAALKLSGWIFHLINAGKFAGDVEITAASFVLGFLQVVFYSYLAAYVFARLYNKLVKSNI